MLTAKLKISLIITSLAVFFSSAAFAADSSQSLSPRIISIRPDPKAKEMVVTIQDPPGVLSYDIYYANSLSATGATTPFVLCQSDYPVSGTGTTQWRDRGASNRIPPLDPSIRMRFYRVKVARNSTVAQILNITPADKSTFLSRAKIDIKVNVFNPSNELLQYRFSIGGAVKQTWSASNTYSWQTTGSDAGSVNVICEVKDARGRVISRTISYRIINPTVDEVLQKVANNYALTYDYKADMVLTSTLNGKPFGGTQYLRYYFKAHNQEKTETYSDAARTNKTDIIITSGSTMHLIDPVKNIKQSVDLLADSGVSAKQFAQVDLYYSKPLFLSEHTINVTNSSSASGTFVILEAVPKTPNKTYDKLAVEIDYDKGFVTSYAIYKRNASGQLELIQELKTIESRQFPNGCWLPVKVTKKPNLTSGEFISTVTYDNLRTNTGLTDSDFDPSRQ